MSSAELEEGDDPEELKTEDELVAEAYERRRRAVERDVPLCVVLLPRWMTFFAVGECAYSCVYLVSFSTAATN